MHHLIESIRTKRIELEYAKTRLLAVLSHGNRAEQLLAIDRIEALRIELRAYIRLADLILGEDIDDNM